MDPSRRAPLLTAPGVGLGLGGLLGAWGLLSPWILLAALPLLPLFRWPLGLGLALVLLRGLLWPVPEPPYGLRLEGVFQVRGGFTAWEDHRLWVRHYPPLEDGLYHLRGYLAPPEGRRNPGGFDQRAWLLAQGVEGVFHVERAEAQAPLPDPRAPFRERLVRGLSPPSQGVVRGLTLGEKDGLGETYAQFQRAGLAHLLALSGLHVGFLVGSLVLLLWPLGRWRYLLALLVLPLYLWLAGPSPSLVRASLMAGLSLLGLFLGLGAAGVLQALGLALFLQLLHRPEALLSLAFQLSHLAVLGIALVLSPLPRPPGPWGYLLGGLLATVAAQAFLAPLLLHRFGFLPLLSPLSNLLALPTVALMVPLGFLKLLLGGVLAPLVEPLAQALLLLARAAAQGPLLRFGEITPVGFALYYLGLLPLLLALHRLWTWRKALVLASLPALAGLLSAWPKPLDLWALDVGQGDALLARMGGGSVLVDGGRPEQGERLLQALRALGVQALEVLVATHPDADHYGGLLRVAEEVPVGLALLSPAFPRDHPLVGALEERGVPLLFPGAGTRLGVGRGSLEVLWPPYLRGDKDEDGLVLLLDFGRARALLLADVPQEVERRLAVEEVAVLKVSHHGSRTGTAEVLLERTRPRVALIGVGRGNPYGQPHPEVLERLAARGAKVYRTDRHGAVRVSFGYAW
ncbi:DNA internalization-related competence protein ComEC/Rec2 [Thermus thermamylovorans]|uniref:DNA internalization-related competence protein ComEC/Rec2 n=1 Tax=Thermus thermamylovorans TaxID=2509362 RepID=A0A4Q9B6A8_9DEIN|nr:DNA internalization-related competence protein ComEC/Rec2 [Thermus thermamylovorans]TBH21246.1 DNA internalization-related competence protein ComEC/Rec2 [Thermus thermamylovorans]